MSHVLDRPVWNALATCHAAHAEGGPLARRYDPTIIPFAAARDASAASLAALATLPRQGEQMMLAQRDPIVVPSGLATAVAGAVAQMVLQRPPPPVSDARIERLGEADAAGMLALAALTNPGPFTLRARALGDFFGIRIDGRIAAMAGERMKVAGYSEVSGVCSHPDFRGRGLARVLSAFMTRRVLSRGETPFLHTFTTNTAAIGLYESLGYKTRAVLNVAMVQKGEMA
jgi:predicted GNAT family acetyltransferase